VTREKKVGNKPPLHEKEEEESLFHNPPSDAGGIVSPYLATYSHPPEKW